VFTDNSKAEADKPDSPLPLNRYRVRARRILASALLAFLGVGMAFVIAEIGVRVLGISRPVFSAYSATRGWKLRAGARGWQSREGRAFVSVNRWGYRGSDWTRVKPAATLRIAMLGDSFIEAQQVAEDATACELIQHVLGGMLPAIEHGRQQRYTRVEVLNFGVDGYGTAQEFFTLLEDVWQFSPDVVVLAFFPGNDVRNNSAVLEGDKCRPFFVPNGDEFVLGGPFVDSLPFHFSCFLRFESYRSQLLNILGESRSALHAALRKWGEDSNPPPRLPQPAGIPRQIFHEPGVNDLIYRPPINQFWRDAWSVSEAEIEMTEQNTRAHHALFLLIIIGTGVQVEPFPTFQAAYLRTVKATDMLYPSHRLTAFGAKNGFAVLDLVPTMKTFAQEHQIYFHGFPNTRLGTGHWNEAGNRFAAALIAKKLATMIARNPDR
jgi:hypothetical protein